MIECASLIIPVAPMAIQSAKFYRAGRNIKSYQPEKNHAWKNTVRMFAKSQLPENFDILNVALRIEVDFLFKPLKSMGKQQLALIECGTVIHKPERPDLTDNLMKGLADALTGVVWRDDSLICEVSSRKRYGLFPAIHIKVFEL